MERSACVPSRVPFAPEFTRLLCAAAFVCVGGITQVLVVWLLWPCALLRTKHVVDEEIHDPSSNMFPHMIDKVTLRGEGEKWVAICLPAWRPCCTLLCSSCRAVVCDAVPFTYLYNLSLALCIPLYVLVGVCIPLLLHMFFCQSLVHLQVFHVQRSHALLCTIWLLPFHIENVKYDTCGRYSAHVPQRQGCVLALRSGFLSFMPSHVPYWLFSQPKL